MRKPQIHPLLSAFLAYQYGREASRWGEIQFDDFHAQKGYSRRKAYGQSKRAYLTFAYELHRRLSVAGYDTLSVAAHPGLSKLIWISIFLL